MAFSEYAKLIQDQKDFIYSDTLYWCWEDKAGFVSECVCVCNRFT